MRASAILATAAACSVIAAPIESRENGEPNLLGGFNLPILGAAGQEGFATFAGFLDNLFNGAIFSPVSKVLQGQPVGAAEDAVTGLVKTGTNLAKNIGATGMAGINGYNPTAKSQGDLAKGAAEAGVNLKSGQGAPSQQSQQAAAQSGEQKTQQQPEQPAPAANVHIVGAPLALADQAYSKKAWVQFKDMTDLQRENITFVHGSVSHVDCAAKKATVVLHGTDEAKTFEYDYFCAATGYRRVWPVVPQSLTYKAYLEETANHIQAVGAAKHGVLVVGGGAVGIEMAAELKLCMPHIKVALAHSRDKLLSSEGLSDECKDVSLDLLKDAGVEVLLNHRLESSDKVDSADGEAKYLAKFTNGSTIEASVVIVGVSQSVPATGFYPAAALDADGKVKIRPNLMLPSEVPNADSHFCAGDATKWSGIKRCGGAMRGGHLVAMNIHQLVLQKEIGHTPVFEELVEIPPMIAMAVGKEAVSSGPEGTHSGTDVMDKYFGTDLYLSGCWKWMGIQVREGIHL